MKIIRNLLLIFLGIILTGCSLKYNLNPPIISNCNYIKTSSEEKIVYIKDDRVDKKFIKGMTGLANVDLKIGNVDDPIFWLANSLKKEFASHGIDVEFTDDKSKRANALGILHVKQYYIVNSRTSGFHPFIAYHFFSGYISDISDTSSSKPINEFFVYGKTPIWSMDEVQGPCFDMPSAILIKGISSKVNRTLLHYKMSDKQVDQINQNISEKIKLSDPSAYLSVLELGESNNKKSIQYLKKYADNKDTLIRACALSALGMIGEVDTFNFLKTKYEQYKDIDRFMALKSIGDLWTPESIKLLNSARNDKMYSDEYGFKFIVELYLHELDGNKVQ